MASIQSEPPDDPIFCSPPGHLIIYDQEEIDRGAYGSVYAGELAGRPVAVKRIHPTLLEAQLSQGENVLREFQAECQRMKDIGRHTNVVGFLGAFQDDKGPFLVMDRMSQNLKKFLESNKGTLSLQQQVRLCLDIATGLAFLHSQAPPLVHRDLSAKNVLLDEARRAKIGDLGQSKLKTAARFETRQPGAVPYMPPEALRSQPQYTEKVDIFSFGVLMLEIATQSPPSGGLEGIGTIPEEERQSGDLACIAEDHPLMHLIRLCLKDDPTERPDAATLKGDLQQLSQASIAFTKAKKHFSSAIEPLEEIHHEAIQLAEKTASPEFEDLKALSTARVSEILRVVDRSEMKVVFFGRTSNGKSTVINALLKSKVLPFGAGSTTTTICYLRGTTSEGGFVKFEGSNGTLAAESAQALANRMQEQRDIQIYWPTAQCSILKGEIVLVDCPGMNAKSEMDDKVIKCCTDADVFVYVANGIATFEMTERDMLAQVKEKISSPSNTFIVFNHWDRVEEDGEEQARRVKEQQLSKVFEIMVYDLDIFTEEMAKSRTFFVSAKQAVNNAQQPGSHLQQEFSRFEEMLQECLLEAAIKTKFGRHYNECQPIVASLREAVTGMNHRWIDESNAREAELRTKELVLKEIDIRMQNFHQIYNETVEGALEKVYAMCDEFHSDTKERLFNEIRTYQPEERFDPAKCNQYRERMKEHLQEKLRVEDSRLKDCWTSQATDVVLSLCDPLQCVEEDVRRFEASRASSRLDSQEGDFRLFVQTAQKRIYSVFKRKTKRFLIGGGFGSAAGAVVGVGVALTVQVATFGVATPLAAAIGALALGGIAVATTKPDSMTEEEAREEVRKQLITFLNEQNHERKRRCRDDLMNHIKSSTDAACRHVEEQKQELNKAVGELEGRIQALRPQLSEALPLVKKLEKMELQLKKFREEYLAT